MSSFTSRCSSLIFTLFVIALLSSLAVGQSVTGSISGTVTDANGGIVTGATITLVNDQTKSERNINTNDSGRFDLAALQPGVYTLKVEHQGFQILLKQSVVVSANESLALGELRLQPGQVTETVTVTSEGAIVERETSDLTARITADQLNLISTKGRDVTSLLRLIASSMSCCGAFCVFLIKPCKRIMWPSPMLKITRAIRLLSRSLRTSHKPRPSGAQCGRPIGQPNSTF